MKKVVIYMEGAQENEKALSLAYAAERTLNETCGIRGMVTVKSMDGLNALQWMFRRRKKRRGRQPRLMEVV